MKRHVKCKLNLKLKQDLKPILYKKSIEMSLNHFYHFVVFALFNLFNVVLFLAP